MTDVKLTPAQRFNVEAVDRHGAISSRSERELIGLGLIAGREGRLVLTDLGRGVVAGD